MKDKFRKNVYMEKSYLADIDPVVQRHQGNFSMAVRECMEFTAYALQKAGSIERAKEIIETNTLKSDLRVGDEVVLKVERVIRK